VLTYNEFTVWRVDRVTSSLVAPGAGVLACYRPWLKSSLLKMEATFGQFSERISRHSKTCDVWWHLTSKKKTVIYDRVWQPANDCRYLATGIGWRYVLGPILRNQHGPCRTASTHAPVCCPYWRKSITCQAFSRILGKNFREHGSRYTQSYGARTTRPCSMGVTHVDSHLYCTRVTRPYNTARVIRLCVSAFN